MSEGGLYLFSFVVCLLGFFALVVTCLMMRPRRPGPAHTLPHPCYTTTPSQPPAAVAIDMGATRRDADPKSK